MIRWLRTAPEAGAGGVNVVPGGAKPDDSAAGAGAAGAGLGAGAVVAGGKVVEDGAGTAVAGGAGAVVDGVAGATVDGTGRQPPVEGGAVTVPGTMTGAEGMAAPEPHP